MKREATLLVLLIGLVLGIEGVMAFDYLISITCLLQNDSKGIVPANLGVMSDA